MGHVITSVKGFLGRTLIVREWLNDDELSLARKLVCAGCKLNIDGVCRMCGCVLDVKVRSRVNVNVRVMPPHLEDTHCPVGKWPVRLDGGSIGGNDRDVANYWRAHNGKGLL